MRAADMPSNTKCLSQASGRCSSLSAGGIQQLLATVLQLRLDPAGCVLAADLEVQTCPSSAKSCDCITAVAHPHLCAQAAAAALLDAFPEADWTRKFGDLAALVAGLGGSHRGGVDAIRLLPGNSGRADLLRSHAAVQLLSGLLLPKARSLPSLCAAETTSSVSWQSTYTVVDSPEEGGCGCMQGEKPPTATKARGAPQPVDPAEVVHAQGWFEGGDGFLRLAKNVRTGALSIWELRSAIELVDVLLWPHVKEVKGTGAAAMDIAHLPCMSHGHDRADVQREPRSIRTMRLWQSGTISARSWATT